MEVKRFFIEYNKKIENIRQLQDELHKWELPHENKIRQAIKKMSAEELAECWKLFTENSPYKVSIFCQLKEMNRLDLL